MSQNCFRLHPSVTFEQGLKKKKKKKVLRPSVDKMATTENLNVFIRCRSSFEKIKI